MVIDTSAILAILRQEPDARRYALAIEGDPVRLASAATLLEAWIVATSQVGEAGGGDLDELISELGVEVVPVTVDHLRLARTGFLRFGKGRHPAGLNFGDCFSYALAMAADEPLLFKGGDFGQTDVRAVLRS
ncbi:MAG: type II toxin-antitoxin system VapC family toxin [Bradymonadales bacterium]|nr:type II toxin-antitoxin system VapC family toxin [Bradymonadales bacterium]